MTGASVPERDAAGLVPLEPRVLWLWRIRAAPAALVVAVVTGWATAVGVAVPAGMAAGALALLVGAGLVTWWTGLVWRAWRFQVGDGALRLRHGVLTRRESTIPFHRVQHIDLEAGPLERRLGLTSLVLRTASASTDATVPGIDTGDAQQLRERILALVGTGDAV